MYVLVLDPDARFCPPMDEAPSRLLDTGICVRYDNISYVDNISYGHNKATWIPDQVRYDNISYGDNKDTFIINYDFQLNKDLPKTNLFN